MKEHVINKLLARGVAIADLAPLVYQLQQPYLPNVTMEECEVSLLQVLDKRDVQHCVLTGITLDELADRELIEEPLLSILKEDDALYGIDEIIALGMTTLYGTVGSTNFGFLDKTKPGIISQLDTSPDQVNTFLDDLVCGLVAAASSRLAHHYRDQGKTE